jgi:UDPglucose--hexose-1-phosphate uridylyltransferase
LTGHDRALTMPEFRSEELTATILDPARDFTASELRLEIRTDPLTGHTSRILPEARLLPPSSFDLAAFAEQTRATCPFCTERIESVTPRFPGTIVPAGRIRVGDALLFPNLLPYSEYSSVSVYSPQRHFLPLEAITPKLMRDNLRAQIEFARAVIRRDPEAVWVSINANHMLPSGSSVFHPHLQGSVNPLPTTMQRLLAAGSGRLHGYLDAERAAAERVVADTANVTWLAAFAPVGPAELRAFVPASSSPVDLGDELVEELAAGISAGLAFYAELGFQSFNFALYGAPPGTDGYALNLRLIGRANLDTLYRSDATWLERLHWEGATDLVPEDVAARARPRFESLASG